MQNFVGKTKCIVGYMKVADCISATEPIANESPIYTVEKFWHGSDEKSTRTKIIGSARIDFVVLTTLPHPCWTKLSPVLGPCREVVRARIKLVRVPENLAQLG